jgi:hypothetical protein
LLAYITRKQVAVVLNKLIARKIKGLDKSLWLCFRKNRKVEQSQPRPDPMEEQKHKEIGENGSKEIWSQPILLKDVHEQPQQQAIVMTIMADASFKHTKVNTIGIAPRRINAKNLQTSTTGRSQKRMGLRSAS